MATIHVDGKAYEVDGADNLLQACLSLGLEIPYFCWHPALESVGACRQCAVKQYANADDTRGRIVMSCMTPATDNSYIAIEDAEAKDFRETIISFLMSNHPHDCPVCEEGGHCHLQDMTVMTRHHKRGYRFTKRTHRNQELGPFIAHEMNRCIACYRCVRYYKDYAGGTDLGVFGSAARVYFGRETDGTLESEFAGNLTEVCPTGVFTDKTHSERYTRKWDMQFAPSICTGCSVGCNISPGERYGEVRRIENRYHGEINGYFLCDRGRFGYGHVNLKDRPRHALSRIGDSLQAAPGTLDAVAALLAAGKPVIGIGSARASIESNHALRHLVGADNFFVAVSAQQSGVAATTLDVISNGPVPVATIRRIEDADAALVLGEDLVASAPRMGLAVRQTANGRRSAMNVEKKVPEWQAYSAQDVAQRELNPVWIASPAATRLDDAARASVRGDVPALVRLATAVTALIDPAAPAATGLSKQESALAGQIADSLLSAKKPVVISGYSCGSPALLQATANLASALYQRNPETRIALTLPEANSLGVAMFQAPSIEAALERAAATDSVLVVLEADLERHADAAAIDAALARSTLVVIDHQMTATAARAAHVLPSATFAEGDGTLVNYEGRAQRYFQNFDPAYYDGSIQTVEAWAWIARLLDMGGRGKWTNLDAVLADIVVETPALAGVVDAAPNAAFRVDGMRIARAPFRQSGRTSMRANVFVHEPRATQDPDTALNFSMEGFNGTQAGERPGSMIPFAWSPGWNSPQAWNKFQDEVGGHLQGGDPGAMLLKAAGTAGSYRSIEVPTPAAGLRAMPLIQHFGSEELSTRAKPIQERMGETSVTLNMADAQSLGLAHGGAATVQLGGRSLSLPVRVRLDFPSGCVGLPAGLPGIPAFVAGAAVSVAKAE